MDEIGVVLGAIDTDADVDAEISRCLNPAKPKSFFVYAGAGSGKTYSLETALERFSDEFGAQFLRNGQRIAVITFTNDARDEILSRVARRQGGDESLFLISTIHSYCWAQIQTFHSDIQKWFLKKLPDEIADLNEKQSKGRAGQASIDRANSIAQKTEKLEWLKKPRKFVYSPSGINSGKASLSHADVLKIAADFISEKPSMQAALINQFPFLLIDESQDTSKGLIDAFFELERKNAGRFGLGLFGDMMQRIYADGQPDLGKNIPEGWATPVKKMNHRSAQRIVELGNSIRRDDATLNHDQMARNDSSVGVARLFVANTDSADRTRTENQVRERMAAICSDDLWKVSTGGNTSSRTVKSLTLEHHMAAARMGFERIFEPLDKLSTLSTGLRDGSLSGVALFSKLVQPLVQAHSEQAHFKLMEL
tara:strand:+ start:521 stop:1789 length:1269 start_codon:yes stop_codon:yes gene_type:complete